MKAIKRRLAMLLVGILFACMLPIGMVNAAEDGSITIKESADSSVTVSDRTFSIYKIFEATTSVTDETKNVSYQWYIPEGENESQYSDFFFGTWTDSAEKNHSALIDPSTVTELNSIGKAVSYIRNLDGQAAKLREFADNLYEYIKVKNIDPVKTSADADVSDTEIEFQNLSYGYYLVVDTTENLGNSGVRSGVMLTTAAPDAEIHLKATQPTINKTIVGRNATGAYFDTSGNPKTEDGYFEPQKSISATIDDVITYAISLKVPDRTEYHDGYLFELEDSIPSEQKLVESSYYIYVNGTEIDGVHKPTENIPDSAPYQISSANKITFNLDATKADGNSLYPSGAMITLTYQVRLSSDMPAKSTNTATLKYTNHLSDKDQTSSAVSTASIYTYQLVLSKAAGTTDGTASNLLLTGARFKIYDDEGNLLSFIQKTDTTGVPFYVVADQNAKETIETLVVLDSDVAGIGTELNNGGHAGQVKIFGLGAGSYELKEIEAPAGYELPQNGFGFVISDSFVTVDGTPLTLSFTPDEVENGGASFQNVSTVVGSQSISTCLTNISGSVLPSTGGIGTTIFTILGIICMTGAVVFLIYRRCN
ncbi:MAG: SpaA isopeptide-forming pilin-related protein [Lachnospiraceae bacterium]